MKVTNVSARLHHVGNVSIAPGETKEVDGAFENSINTDELQVTKDAPVAPASKTVPKAPFAPVAPASKTVPKAPFAPVAPVAPPAK